MSENQVGLKFAMPFADTLEIRSSKPINEDEIGIDQEVEGIVYSIYWGDVPLPWFTKTQLQASAIALGCQWGAQQIANRSQMRFY